MTRKGFDFALEQLNDDIIRMGSIVEKQIHQSIEALVQKDINLAEQIIANDDLVDNFEKEIENKCIRLIGKEQPLAIDLRTIFTCSKIITDLERIADHAVDVAKVVKRLKNENYIKELIDIPKMASLVEVMIKQALDAFVEGNVKASLDICKLDDEVDGYYKKIFRDLLELMTKDNSTINQGTQFLFVAKNLERVADHVTNICEWTVYLVTGELVDLND
ncbi:MAG: phosphate signaling complex protein PhoU [Solirubrobacterales bacterium]